ncbi:MAG: S-adenosylmethionine synthetase N-terminal domain-containing protein [Bacteroidaceae bacterium]|nr:S-adenosylmethionine synthetase N-terminal domain-containing protein [Bacteroidaceae bacterium]
MIEKVNPSHPDKVADRIAGALVDYAYTQEDNPRIAVEVLIGHEQCTIIAESSVQIPHDIVADIVSRIVGLCRVHLICVPQDKCLADNQHGAIRCGDNGIFKGMPLTVEERRLSDFAHTLYQQYPTDGKFILAGRKLVVCQSCADSIHLHIDVVNTTASCIIDANRIIINPLGYWTGGIGVDSGATNRKLGSDMAQSVTGGGLHGKDLSKADVSVNIYAFLEAQRTGRPVELCCAIGDTEINGIPYAQIVEQAREYIKSVGGFEKFAEWGLY